MSTSVIDHVDQLVLAEPDNWVNELKALSYLKRGLDALFHEVKAAEEKVQDSFGSTSFVVAWGNHPALASVDQELLASAFNWYSISACNYVRLVGFLVSNGDRSAATKYVKRVIPVVYAWRNKVGAHFALLDPRNDTAADLAASVMFPVGWSNGAFVTRPFTLHLSTGDQLSRSRDLSWSLTQTHFQLAKRYWPAASV